MKQLLRRPDPPRPRRTTRRGRAPPLATTPPPVPLPPMPNIALPIDVPGIRVPLAFRPDAAKHLLGLAERRLRDQGCVANG